MSRPLRLLVQRAQSVGVVDHTNVGLCVSALHHLKLLHIDNNPLLEVILCVIHRASTRSKVNVLECLVRNVDVDNAIIVSSHTNKNNSNSNNENKTHFPSKDECNNKQPFQSQKNKLPDAFHNLLQEIQSDLMQTDAIEELNVNDIVLFTEALLRLITLCYTSDVNHNLLCTLQDRLLAFVNVITEPQEWLSIVQLAIEVNGLPVRRELMTCNALQCRIENHTLNHNNTEVYNGTSCNNNNNNNDKNFVSTNDVSTPKQVTSLLRVNSLSRASIDEETHRWSNELIKRILTNITPYLNSFTKRELMQLFDTITHRRVSIFDFSRVSQVITKANNLSYSNSKNDKNEHLSNLDEDGSSVTSFTSSTTSANEEAINNNNYTNSNNSNVASETTTITDIDNDVNKTNSYTSQLGLPANDANLYESIPDSCRVLIKAILDLVMERHLEHLTLAQSSA